MSGSFCVDLDNVELFFPRASVSQVLEYQTYKAWLACIEIYLSLSNPEIFDTKFHWNYFILEFPGKINYNIKLSPSLLHWEFFALSFCIIFFLFGSFTFDV